MRDYLEYREPHPLISATQESGEPVTGRDGKAYLPSADLLAAANAALELQMPLLLTGEAGCGKTDFAFAAAQGLGRHPNAGSETTTPLECYVRSDTRARDLLYHYDAIRRFGDAQHGGETGRRRAEDPRAYIRLQPLGRALMSPYLRVVLIDEIDKAPRDLPNDLLRELDQGCFEIPEIPAGLGDRNLPIDLDDPETFRNEMIGPRKDEGHQRLVIITSNVERQLPDPFLRRCVFYHIPFPAERRLKRILHSWFNEEDLFIDRVIDVFMTTREVPTLTKKPATSELISWAGALLKLFDRATVERALDDFAGGPFPETRAREQGYSKVRWHALPAIGCLIKLREDLEQLYDLEGSA